MNIVWLGDIGFPVGLAATQKSYLVCKGLAECDVKPTVISRKSPHRKNADIDIQAEGTVDGIDYIYASGIPYRPEGFLIRNLTKVRGLIGEICILYGMKRKGGLDAAILHTQNFSAIVFYRILSTLLRFPLVMAYVELYSSLATESGIRHKLNVYLYERYGFMLLNGIMPISEYLVDFVEKRTPSIPLMKLPMIADFERFKHQDNRRNSDERYFLFCGGAIYLEVIVFVLRVFELLDASDEIKLYLVCGGTDCQMTALRKEIDASSKSDMIRLFSGISNEHLTCLYSGAHGLLIPLRETLQDTARFPHKLGEYFASGNPVVTTAVGEVAHYFTDGDSVLIADNYDVVQYAAKIQFLLENPRQAARIGKRGRALAQEYFDYRMYGPKVRNFISNLINI